MGKDLKGKELGRGFTQNKDGRYKYRYVDRFGKRRTLYDKKLATLKRTAKYQIAKNVLGMNPQKNNHNLDNLFNEWVEVYKKDYKESTIYVYKGIYGRMMKDCSLSNKPIEKITPIDIKVFLDTLVDNYSNAICINTRGILVRLFDFAILKQYIMYNPVTSMKIKSKKKPKKVDSLTIGEEKLFLEYIKGDFFNPLYTLILNTGLRIGEAAGLSIEDIDLKRKLIHVKHTLYIFFEDGKTRYVLDTPKNGKERIIPLNNTALNAVKKQLNTLKLLKKHDKKLIFGKYKEIEGFENMLFLSRTGKPLNSNTINDKLFDTVQKIRDDGHEIKSFSTHVLRHTFATRCSEKNIPYNVIKEYLGHQDINTTMSVYVSNFIEDNKDVYRLDESINQNGTKMVQTIN